MTSHTFDELLKSITQYIAKKKAQSTRDTLCPEERLTITLRFKMVKEKCKKNEDELERRRIARREKYKRIKSDPEKYAVERAKKKEAYLKRKREKKVKNINQMSPRAQRAQRKRWRENSKRYLEKKAQERKIQEVTISQVLEAHIKINDKEFSDPLYEENVKKRDK
ncbi:unnamed protein product [Parnassius apollo]|uniref:(apollo) hypothetical protein n=1 Tax=Parnassius apollo TaxID=110799 RepID=A0A8S3Y425_PARAO|nr:unnamed protein product [Parnassius apollo]